MPLGGDPPGVGPVFNGALAAAEKGRQGTLPAEAADDAFGCVGAVLVHGGTVTNFSLYAQGRSMKKTRRRPLRGAFLFVEGAASVPRPCRPGGLGRLPHRAVPSERANLAVREDPPRRRHERLLAEPFPVRGPFRKADRETGSPRWPATFPGPKALSRRRWRPTTPPPTLGTVGGCEGHAKRVMTSYGGVHKGLMRCARYVRTGTWDGGEAASDEG